MAWDVSEGIASYMAWVPRFENSDLADVVEGKDLKPG